MNELYPVFLKLKGKTAVVVGGGPVAGRRAVRLVESGARVRVVSPEVVGDIERLHALGRLEWRRREFQPGDVEGAALVLAATGDPRVLEAVRALSDRHGFLLNAAEDEGVSDFHVPAVVEQNPLKIAVSTGGLSPSAAVKIRDAIAAWMSANRPLIQKELATGRRSAPSSGVASPPQERHGEEEARESARQRHAAVPGWVHLVGAGPGDPSLLTVKGRDLITSADVVFYDRLVSDGILDIIPDATEKVYVGKEVGCANRANICRLLVEAAESERAVVRLKGGDPLIFGRGGEEMLALRQADIPFEVVPGVSAMNAAPAAACIPVTFRGIASEVVMRSGHRLRHNRLEETHRLEATEAIEAGVSTYGLRETTYIYFMAMSRLEQVVEELLAEGVEASTPAAIVENATLPGQRLVTAELGGLVELARRRKLAAPALVVVGNVVLFRELRRFLPLLEQSAGVAESSGAGSG